MESTIAFFYGSEESILQLTPESGYWVERAFYYPVDKTYFYQAFEGSLKKYGAGDVSVIGEGITINSKVIGGVKYFILEDDILYVPEYYEYNIYKLSLSGSINNNGVINIQ